MVQDDETLPRSCSEGGTKGGDEVVTLPEPIVCAARAVKVFMKHALNKTPASLGRSGGRFDFA